MPTLEFHTRAYTTVPVQLSHLVNLHTRGLACDADGGAVDGRDGAGLERQTARVYSNTASRTRAAAQCKLRISHSLCVCVCWCVYTHVHTHTHKLSHTRTHCMHSNSHCAHKPTHKHSHMRALAQKTHTCVVPTLLHPRCYAHAATPTHVHPLAPGRELFLLSLSLSLFLVQSPHPLTRTSACWDSRELLGGPCVSFLQCDDVSHDVVMGRSWSVRTEVSAGPTQVSSGPSTWHAPGPLPCTTRRIRSDALSTARQDMETCQCCECCECCHLLGGGG